MKPDQISRLLLVLFLHAWIQPMYCKFSVCGTSDSHCIVQVMQRVIEPLVIDGLNLPATTKEFNSTCLAFRKSGDCLKRMTETCRNKHLSQIFQSSFKSLTENICNQHWPDKILVITESSCIGFMKDSMVACNPLKLPVVNEEKYKCTYYSKKYDCMYRIGRDYCGDLGYQVLHLWLKPLTDYVDVFCEADHQIATFGLVIIALVISFVM